jgi:hypothetical protein
VMVGGAVGELVRVAALAEGEEEVADKAVD